MLRLHRSLYTTVALAAVVFAAFALNPVLRAIPLVLMSDAPASASRSQSDTGGQTASPNPSGGFDQEERVRQWLVKQYEQRFGTSDEAIRSSLGIRGKVADFVGYNAERNQWLIAESKGNQLADAVAQLRNTFDALVSHEGNVGRVELRIYMNKLQHEKLLAHQLSGWELSGERYLGWYNEIGEWNYELVRGLKIFVQVVNP